MHEVTETIEQYRAGLISYDELREAMRRIENRASVARMATESAREFDRLCAVIDAARRAQQTFTFSAQVTPALLQRQAD